MKKFGRKSLASFALLATSGVLMFGGAFALLTDSYTETIAVTVENVDVSATPGTVHLEDPTIPGTPVTELTSGVTYNVVGTITNDSTVDTTVTLDTTGVNATYGLVATTTTLDVPVDSDIDVSAFGITITPTALATDGDLVIKFDVAEDTTPV